MAKTGVLANFSKLEVSKRNRFSTAARGLKVAAISARTGARADARTVASTFASYSIRRVLRLQFLDTYWRMEKARYGLL